jgi:hypothetical protein
MEYAVEMGSGAMIYIQKLRGAIHRQHGDRKAYFYFLEIRKLG